MDEQWQPPQSLPVEHPDADGKVTINERETRLASESFRAWHILEQVRSLQKDFTIVWSSGLSYRERAVIHMAAKKLLPLIQAIVDEPSRDAYTAGQGTTVAPPPDEPQWAEAVRQSITEEDSQ